MSKKRQVCVPVQFTGEVTVEVPADWSDEMAEDIALAMVLATCDNPDAPLDQIDVPDSITDEEIDEAARTARVSGTWIVPK